MCVFALGCGDNVVPDQPTRIVGRVWSDVDRNSAFDDGEAALAGNTVFLDLDNDGNVGASEPMVQTGPDGNFEFSVDPGSYVVRQVLPRFGFRSGIKAKRDDRGGSPIIGGTVATPGEFGFMVAVGDLFDGQVFQFCGGVLISDRYVVTAAHCSEGVDPASAGVLAGTLDLTTGGEVLLVDKIDVHPDYDGNTEHGSDIGLWTLQKPVDLAALGLSTVELASPETAALTAPDVLATSVGWGVSDSPSQLLQRVHLPIVGEATCAAVYPQATGLDSQICAGAPEGGIDTCQGDSGGPLLVRDDARGVWLHAGITSWGDGCALPDTPGVYGRTSALSQWAISMTDVEVGGKLEVTVADQQTATADFPTQPTTRPQVGPIDTRWQLTGITLPDTVPANRPIDVSWRIIGESPSLTGFSCSLDPDGPGPTAAQDVACGIGPGSAQIPGLPTGIFQTAFSASRAGANFTRRVDVFAGRPRRTVSRGRLATTDPTDPDYGDPYFVDYFEVTALSGTKAFAIDAGSMNFDMFLTLYDADLRNATTGGGILAFGSPLTATTQRLVVFPEPGRRYLIGISTFAPQEIGAYQVTIVNDGVLRPFTL